MNNTFNMQRFLWLFNKHTKENYKSYLMSTGMLVAILTTVLGLVSYLGGLSDRKQEEFFAFFLIFSGCVFGSLAFSNLSDKSNAMSTLMLPVSAFERFLVTWIYSFVIFQVVFLACFYAVDFVILSIYNLSSPDKMELLNLTSADTTVNVIFIYFWFLHGVSFLGSIFFKKLHFIKTALIFFLGLIILIFINQKLAPLIIGDQVSVRAPFSSALIKEEFLSYHIADNVSSKLIMTFMFCISVLCLWVAAYFKLKEKQV